MSLWQTWIPRARLQLIIFSPKNDVFLELFSYLNYVKFCWEERLNEFLRLVIDVNLMVCYIKLWCWFEISRPKSQEMNNRDDFTANNNKRLIILLWNRQKAWKMVKKYDTNLSKQSKSGSHEDLMWVRNWCVKCQKKWNEILGSFSW